jgi:phage tail-like protein
VADDDFLGGEPSTTSRFLFEVDGVEIGTFREVHGLSVTIDTTEVREGGENGFSHVLPGRMSWPHLVFKRGIVQSDALFDWLNKSSGDGFAANGNKITRSTGAVTVMSNTGVRLRAWDFDGVFAVRWSGPDFDTSSDNALEEELEVAHTGFRSKKPAS